MKEKNKKILFITLFIIVAALMRLIPHPPNFVPITAIAIFAGVKFNNIKIAYTIPISIMLISDLFIGFYSISLFVYLAFILIITYSSFIKKYSLKNIILSSVMFFVITNFGVWLMGGYPKSIEGLVLCYTMAIPFFTNSIIADLFFSAILYYGFEKIEKRYLILKS
ncbi:MAG: DUF6580 family putative transport protein [Flavobacteriales bacterium]|jgi:hypothetical protein|tara:strand:- start:40059 stop:40556 length:498 start_codon:yes stop_codon:yes gene_type:complete